MINSFRPFGDMTYHPQLVVNFMQVAVPFTDRRGGDLAGDTHDRREVRPGCAQGGRGVEQARSGHHRINANLAGRPGIAVGHIRDALFVSGVNQTYVVSFFVHGVKQIVELTSGQTEYGINPVNRK